MALTRFNFLPNQQRSTPQAWLWLLPAVLGLALAAWYWQAQQEKMQLAQSHLQNLLAQHAPAPKVQRSKEEQRALEAQAAPLVQAVRQLNLPIPKMMKALQAPADIRVALLDVDFGGRASGSNAQGQNAGPSSPLAASSSENENRSLPATRGNALNLKILAEAKTGAEMLSYVAYLDDAGLFASVYLLRHEIVPETGHYRFQLELQWQP